MRTRRLSSSASLGDDRRGCKCVFVVAASCCRYDKEVFVPRPLYGFAAFQVLTGLKLMFLANPMPVLAEPKKKKQ